MKRLTAIILFCVYMISGSEMREIVKLPVLLQHFEEHKALNGRITFTQFLIDHYNDLPHTDNDEERDNQLPFKQVDSNTSPTPVITVTHSINLRKPAVPLAVNELFSGNDQFVPSGISSRIWQPPRRWSAFMV